MGRDSFLQDDTGLADQRAWGLSDGRGLAAYFLDDAVIDVFERHLGLTLTPLRRVADDSEWWIVREVGEADEGMLRERLATFRAEMDAAWRPIRTYQRAVEVLLVAVASPAIFTPELLVDLRAALGPTSRPEQYYPTGYFAEDLACLLAMLRHADRRGAQRVRFVVR